MTLPSQSASWAHLLPTAHNPWAFPRATGRFPWCPSHTHEHVLLHTFIHPTCPHDSQICALSRLSAVKLPKGDESKGSERGTSKGQTTKGDGEGQRAWSCRPPLRLSGDLWASPFSPALGSEGSIQALRDSKSNRPGPSFPDPAPHETTINTLSCSCAYVPALGTQMQH